MFKRFNNLSITVKLATAILFAALLPMAGSAYYNLVGSLAAVNRTELRNIELLATSIAGRVAQLIGDYRNLAVYLGIQENLLQLMRAPERQQGREAVLGTFNSLVATHPDIELLMAVDLQGNVLVSSDPELPGKNFQFRSYFREAVQGRTYATSISVGAVAGNAGMFLSSPIRNPAGSVQGVAVIKVKGEAIGRIVEQMARRGHNAFIIDGDGVVIYHRDSRWRYHSLMPLTQASQKRIAEDRRFRLGHIDSLGLIKLGEAMINADESGHVRYAGGPDNVREIAGYAPVTGHTWVVGVSEPESLFSAPLQLLISNTLYSLILVALLAVLLAWLFSRSLVRPLRALMRSAEAVELGEYEKAEAKIESADEVGKLAGTFNKMLIGICERKKIKDVFGRMVSPEVREKLLTGSLSLGGETIRVSVLFSDIRGFSTLAERMSAQEVVSFLNAYLTEMSIAARNWGGYINNFIGDAIVVVFGAPMAQSDIEWRAVAAALEMRDRLRTFNLRRQMMNEISIQNGIGISTGDVVAGQIGSLDRFLYTVIGDAVNIAARLEALTRHFPEHPILINRATRDALREREEVKITDLGFQAVKGRVAEVEVFAVQRSARN